LDMTKRKNDEKIINSLPRGKIPGFIFMHLRDMWAVDGLYFLEIEKRYGTNVAAEIDKKVWSVMGKIEARRLKKLFNINNDDIKTMINALRLSGWWLDLEDKEMLIINEKKAIIRNLSCRVQKTRIKKNLGEFPCKPVRLAFLKSFTAEFNPGIIVKSNICPPDKHPDDLWCEWEFKIKGVNKKNENIHRI